MAKIIHVMLRCLDLAASKAFYKTAFGLEPAHELDFPDFTLSYLRNAENDMEIELTWNKGRQQPYSHGDGYGHVAVCVDDLEAEHARLVQAGLSPLDIKRFHDGDTLLAQFFFILDPDGYKIEVLQRHGHYQ